MNAPRTRSGFRRALLTAGLLALLPVASSAAVLHDTAYMNVGTQGRFIADRYDLQFQSVNSAGTRSAWQDADTAAGIDVSACAASLVVGDSSSTCTTSIYVRNTSPRLASTLTLTVSAGSGSDAAVASAVRFAVTPSFGSSRWTGQTLGARVTLVDGASALTHLPAGGAEKKIDLQLSFADMGATANAALNGKSITINARLDGSSVVP